MPATTTRTEAREAQLSNTGSIWSFRTCLCAHHDPNGAFYKDNRPIDLHYFECRACARKELLALAGTTIPAYQVSRISREISLSNIPELCRRENCKKTRT